MNTILVENFLAFVGVGMGIGVGVEVAFMVGVCVWDIRKFVPQPETNKAHNNSKRIERGDPIIILLL